ncbi:MAG TPA: dihydrodipicolinate synthase family protein [Brevibacterium sp.]|nr:dihydrodipicolinate synthase family protein [Brevibacterium sp.]
MTAPTGPSTAGPSTPAPPSTASVSTAASDRGPATADLHGVLSALATPFDADDALDVPALHRVIDRSLDSGVHGVVAGGSTGEFASLLPDERMRLVEEVTTHTAGRVPVIAQTGATTTTEAIRHSRAAHAAGADALMLVTPYYEPLSLTEAVDYLRTVADAVELPIMLYNIPDATGLDLDPETVAALADEFDHIRFIKDSSADWALGLQLIHHLGDRVGTFIGWDVYAYGALVEGAAGIMAGSANVLGPELVAVHDAVSAGDLAGGLARWKRLYPVIDRMLSAEAEAALEAALASLDSAD